MRSQVQFLFKFAVVIFITGCNGLIYNPGSVSSSTGGPPIPQYRFHYYVRDENTGDYKSQEEHRSGDSVTGSYMVGEPNGDLRVVKYVADVSNGFKADVNVHPGGSPMKPSTTHPKEGTVTYNNQRTGISAPPKQRKPVRGFNPIVVKSLSSFTQSSQPTSSKPGPSSTSTSPNYSYAYYRANSETAQNISSEFTTPVIPQKSVQVELTYKDDTMIEKNIETVVLPEKKILESSSTESTSTAENKNFNLQSLSYLSTETPTSKNPPMEIPLPSTSPSTNGLYQLDSLDIPSSIIEILNQQKSNFKNIVSNPPTYVSDTLAPPVTTETPIYKHEVSDNQIKNSIITETESNVFKKVNLPLRPMRLIGLSPIYMDHSQLQAITENLTSPQIPFDHIVNIQYATPAPFISGPLLGGPAPFRNIPRSVSELSDTLPNPVPANLPIINSLPISAPIISQADTKQEIKPVPPPPPASLPLCNDCLLPPNYMPYPVMRFPTTATNNNNQKPCAPENTPYWTPYKPGFAYILMPSQIIKNNS